MFQLLNVPFVLLCLTDSCIAGTVTLTLNTENGVPGLEEMLEIARRNAPTMQQANIAVSLYNALQAAKQQSAQDEQKQGAARDAEIDRLRKELDAAKAVPEVAVPEKDK